MVDYIQANFLAGLGSGPMSLYWPLWILLIAWSLAWKGVALWHAARRGEPAWFVALLVINTLGVLEILYLYVFGGIKSKTEQQEPHRPVTA